jgi:hypothetical protein
MVACAPFIIAIIYGLTMTGCVIGRLDSDHLRVIPITEVHRMDDKGFPLNLFQTDHAYGQTP